MKKNRLKEAEEKYCKQLHECLTNPKNENLPNDIIETKIEEAFNGFIQALVQNEDECACFISKGNVMDELEILPIVFDRFKSVKIYEAIKANCEVAFSHKFTVESKEVEQKRKIMLDDMKQQLILIGLL